MIMPSPRARQYTEFYSGFKHYAQSHGFLVTQHLINENTPSSEEEAFMDIKPLQVKGIACISTAAGTLFEDKIYKDQEDRSQVSLVEHLPSFDADFIGFDYEAGPVHGAEGLEKGLHKRLPHDRKPAVFQ